MKRQYNLFILLHTHLEKMREVVFASYSFPKTGNYVGIQRKRKTAFNLLSFNSQYLLLLVFQGLHHLSENNSLVANNP
jgi:hypothetical protein